MSKDEKPHRRRGWGEGCVIYDGKRKRYFLFCSINGKRIKRTIHDPNNGVLPRTHKEAERLAVVMNADLRTGGKLGLFTQEIKKTHNLAELNQVYLDSFSSTWTPKRRRTWNQQIGESLKSFFTVESITHDSLGRHIKKRLDTPTWQGVPRKNSTVNRELAALKRLLSWSVQTGRIDKNPMLGFELLKEPHHRERILTKEELSRLLPVLNTPRFELIRLIVLIALTTGMRLSEILRLRWDDLNKKNHEFDLLKTKSGKRRKVPIPDLVLQELNRLTSTSEYLFPSPRVPNQPISEIKKSFRSLMKAAKITGCRFHDLRHTFASAAAENGTPVHTLQEILGHASITTTQRYFTTLKESKQKAVNQIAEQILQPKED